MIRTSPALRQSLLARQITSAYEGNFSFSATEDENTISQLIPVKISDEHYSEMSSRLFPDKPPVEVTNLTIYLTYISAYIRSIYLGLVSGLYAANSHPSYSDLGMVISRNIHTSYVDLLSTGAKRTKKGEKEDPALLVCAEQAYSALREMQGGGTFIIHDSDRYKGGYDIKIVGHGCGDNATGIRPPTPQFKPPSLTVNSNSTQYKLDLAERFPKDQVIFDAILELANDLQNFLTGESGKLTHAYTRRVHQLNVTVDLYKKINHVIWDSKLVKLGVALTLPNLGCPHSPTSFGHISNIMSTLVLVDPSDQMLNIKRQSNLPDESLPFSKIALALQPNVRFGYAVNLKPEWVSFITQTEKGGKPSLASLATWAGAWTSGFFKPSGTRDGKNKGFSVKLKNVPRYVLPASKASEISERRKAAGFYVEEGRNNEDGLTLTDHGTLSWLPAAKDHSSENAITYEKTLEEALELAFEAGTPLSASTEGSTGSMFDLAHPEYAGKIRELKDKLRQYRGSAIAYNWDLNTVITVTADLADRLTSYKITGSVRPDEINIAEYLRRPINVGFREMFSRARDLSVPERPVLSKFSVLAPAGFMRNTVVANVLRLYQILVINKVVPSVSDLIERAKADLKITNLNDEAVAPFELNQLNKNRSIYGVINPNLSFLRDEFSNPEYAGLMLTDLLSCALNDASADSSNSNLLLWGQQNHEDPTGNPHYFDFSVSTFGEFSNIYNYFGGRVFLMALKAILAVKTDKLMGGLPQVEAFLNYQSPMQKIAPVLFKDISTEVIPFCRILGHYIPEKKEEIYKKADELIAKNNNKDAFTMADVKIPGSRPPKDGRPGMQAFPHQADGMVQLRSHPRYAVLDISAGGGKTILGLSEIAMMLHEKLLTTPAFVFCPSNLLKNWVADMHKITSGQWNVIPIDSEVYATWGDKKLTEMIMKAPRNTIVLIGNSFLSQTKKTQLVIGNAVDTVSNALEFVKKFKPQLIIDDESHRLRNPGSNLHKAMKAICTMSSVKYVRMCTGSLIQNVMSDVVGQSLMFNGQIFRTKQEFDEENMESEDVPGTNLKAMQYRKGTAITVRERFAEAVTIISKKRRDWAFMLPIPIETHFWVSMERGDDDIVGKAHQLMYDTELRATIESLMANSEIMNLAKRVNKKGAVQDDLDDDDDNDNDEDGSPEAKKSPVAQNYARQMGGKSIDVTEDDEAEGKDGEALTAKLAEALDPYIQRLEQMLIDPFGDPELLPLAKKFFPANVNRDNFVSAKTAIVIERLKLHFEENKWEKGKKYQVNTVVDHLGKSYVLRPNTAPDGESTMYASFKAPDADEENWSAQSRGKVIIFCRYTRTVESIYRALPDAFKKVAIRYHGGIKDKEEQLDLFKEDKKHQILIANEQGISEGHNMQCASRNIRVESPWTPGELDQSAARIFRPDVENKFERELIFLDWVVCNKSLEVAKFGRILSKTLQKVAFDEVGNARYADINPLNLPVIGMSLQNLRDLDDVSQLCSISGGDGSEDGGMHASSYMGQYILLTRRTAEEFREMKKSLSSKMEDIEPTPMPEDATIIEFTPWLPNMEVPDRNNEGLESVKLLLEDETNPLTMAVAKDIEVLRGKLVRTEMGYGKIVGINRTKRPSELAETDVFIPKITSFTIDLVQGGRETMRISKVFIAKNLAEKDAKRYDKKAPKITPDMVDRSSKRESRREVAVDRASHRQAQLANPRRQFAREPEPEIVVPTTDLALHAVVYNRMLALEIEFTDPEAKMPRSYGFRKCGDYAWINAKDLPTFHKILDYMEAHFTLPKKTLKLFNGLMDSWQTGRGRKFDIEQAPVSQIPLFYQASHKPTVVTNRKYPECEFWPVILHSHLLIVVDLKNNPAFLKHISKPISGTPAKFERAEGLYMQIFRTKGEMTKMAKQINAEFNIINRKEFKEEFDSLDLKLVK